MRTSGQTGAKPAAVSTIWQDSQNASGDWISFLLQMSFLKAACVYALHEKMLQDSPKLWK